MRKIKIISAVALCLLALFAFGGCASGGQDLDGMYVVTFEMKEGTMNLGPTSVSTKVNFAYDPGALIMDPTTYPSYSLYRSGYTFTGWYKDPDCNENSKWDFKTDRLDVEKLTLYAGWTENKLFTFSVCYVDEVTGETCTIDTYRVTEGEVFDDYSRFASQREGYTAEGYYEDPACTKKWDKKFTHPGGMEDLNIPVYVNYIKGDWLLIRTAEDLQNAFTASGDNRKSVYLMNDIDCGGKELNFSGKFSGIFNGNGHTVSNFKVKKSGSSMMPGCSIFGTLSQDAEIRDVNFSGVQLEFSGISSNARKIKVAALAKEASAGTKIVHVSVSGVLSTDYSGELPKLNEAIYEELAEGVTVELEDFTSNITKANAGA